MRGVDRFFAHKTTFSKNASPVLKVLPPPYPPPPPLFITQHKNMPPKPISFFFFLLETAVVVVFQCFAPADEMVMRFALSTSLYFYIWCYRTTVGDISNTNIWRKKYDTQTKLRPQPLSSSSSSFALFLVEGLMYQLLSRKVSIWWTTDIYDESREPHLQYFLFLFPSILFFLPLMIYCHSG